MLGIYFLGTSSGVPTKERNVSATAIILPEPKSWVLVDCGEGTQHQILHSPLSLNTLKAIAITHLHGDHCYGLPGLIASAGMAGRTEPLTIIGPKELEPMYLAVKEYSQLFTPFEVIFINTETLTKHQIASTEISAIPLSHRIPSHGFCFTATKTKKVLLSDKLNEAGVKPGLIWGELQQGKDVSLENGDVLKACDYVRQQTSQRRIIVGGDNDDPSLLASAAGQADVLIHESTYTENLLQKIGPGPMHCSAQRIAEFAENQGIPNLILTHISARYQSNRESAQSITEIEKEASHAYSGKLFIANDHDEFMLTAAGELLTRH